MIHRVLPAQLGVAAEESVYHDHRDAGDDEAIAAPNQLRGFLGLLHRGAITVIQTHSSETHKTEEDHPEDHYSLFSRRRLESVW